MRNWCKYVFEGVIYGLFYDLEGYKTRFFRWARVLAVHRAVRAFLCDERDLKQKEQASTNHVVLNLYVWKLNMICSENLLFSFAKECIRNEKGRK